VTLTDDETAPGTITLTTDPTSVRSADGDHADGRPEFGERG
jgi:hypothetical protein